MNSRANITAIIPDASNYWQHFDKISNVEVNLNLLEKLWAACESLAPGAGGSAEADEV